MTLGGDDGDEPCALISIECIKSLSLKQLFFWKRGTFLNLTTGATFSIELPNNHILYDEIVRAA